MAGPGSASLLNNANELETSQHGFNPQGIPMGMIQGTTTDTAGHQVDPAPPFPQAP